MIHLPQRLTSSSSLSRASSDTPARLDSINETDRTEMREDRVRRAKRLIMLGLMNSEHRVESAVDLLLLDLSEAERRR
ncbi:MAG: hypothetical protein AAGG38_11185 [Planctomycetota bacterium]